MLKVKNVSFAYDSEPVLKNVSFSINRGENVSVIGVSGCGKSTLLQIIYGLHDVKGEIYWDDKKLLGPNFNLVAGEQFFKYLAQDFDLMLPLSVADNVGKHLSNMYPVKKKRRVQELLEVVEMQDLANTKTRYLSGGQQQRVALARALAKEPELLLLDEPFSHIDHFRRNNLRRRLFSYLKEKNITCLVATHDSTDALSFADQTIALKNGKVHAKDVPQQLYNDPKDKYVASLFGDVNELMLKHITGTGNSRKKILIYPHEIKTGRKPGITARVLNSYFKGANYLIQADLKGEIVYFEHTSEIAVGKEIFLKIPEKLITSRLK